MEWDELLNIDDVVLGERPATIPPLFSDYLSEEIQRSERLDLLLARVSSQSALAGAKLQEVRAMFNMTDRQVDKAASKMFAFLEAMNDGIDIADEVLSFGNTSEGSIIVGFRQRRDMKLTIYFENETCGDIPDYEEAFLYYEENGEYHMTNDTLNQIVEKIKSLI